MSEEIRPIIPDNGQDIKRPLERELRIIIDLLLEKRVITRQDLINAEWRDDLIQQHLEPPQRPA